MQGYNYNRNFQKFCESTNENQLVWTISSQCLCENLQGASPSGPLFIEVGVSEFGRKIVAC